MADLQCVSIPQYPYPDPKDENQPCPYTSKSDVMIGVHKRATHIKKEAAKVKIKDEVKSDTKKAKRIKSKAVKFCENESREEFRRKRGEFQSYQERMDIKGEDIADDLYRCCETPLKRKLITSSLINDNIKKTDPKVMMDKIERLCLPRVNVIVERDQFCQMEQGEDESINDFEYRVRAKAQTCEFGQMCKTCTCKSNREEDEIKTQILCKMMDKGSCGGRTRLSTVWRMF